MIRLANCLAAVNLASTAVANAVGNSKAGFVARRGVDCCRVIKDETDIQNVFVPGDDGYEERRESYFSVTSQLDPQCYVQPQNTEEVSQAIKAVVESTECKFAIRSGGHSSNAGANNVDDGVTIDLGLLKGVEYNDETGLASVLPATTWLEVYSYLDPLRKGVLGGRQGDVGAGGLLLGGGFSYYLYRDGLCSDYIRRVEIVLADGSIVEADAEHNPDLLKILKGGGGNFGIVTRFDLQTFDINPIWQNVKEYTEDSNEAIIRAMKEWTDRIEDYRDASATVYWMYNSERGDTRISSLIFDVSGTEAAPALDVFDAVGGNISAAISHNDMSFFALDNLQGGNRDVWWSITIKNDEKIMAKHVALHSRITKEWEQEFPGKFLDTMVFFQPFPSYLGKEADNIVGLDRLKDNAYVLLGRLAVQDEELESVARKKSAWWRKELEKYAKSRDGLLKYQYMNYALGSQDVVASYGKKNVCLMWKVSREVDPHGVFQKRQAGGFKLPRVDC